MPIISPEENEQFLINAVPGRPERIEEEERRRTADMQDPLDMLSGLRERVQALTRDLYPTNDLRPHEQQAYSDLSRRYERLAPVAEFAPGQLGSARNPSNPYSIDTRGAATGLGNLAGALINRRRARQREEIEPALTSLAQRQAQALEGEEATRDLINKLAPTVVEEGFRRDRETTEREHEAQQNELERNNRLEREQARTQREKDLLQQRHKNDQDILRLEQKLASDPNNPQTRNRYVSAVQNQIDAIDPLYDIKKNQLENNLETQNKIRGGETYLGVNEREEALNRLREEEALLLNEIQEASTQRAELWKKSGMGLNLPDNELPPVPRVDPEIWDID